MHIFFSGIGGSGVGPLALIAKQAGYAVSGSDAQPSAYIDYLKERGVTDIHIGQTAEQLAKVHQQTPIDWFVYSSALPKTDPRHPELEFCRRHHIKTSKRGDLINEILSQKNLKLIAVAGTHGKTTTTAMVIWLFKRLELPVSYSLGAKISFGDMGQYQAGSEYFVYEADEYDRNFLSFFPDLGLITGLDWDHPDIYPSRQSYYDAFGEFISQCQQVVLWQADAEQLGLEAGDNLSVLDGRDPQIERRTDLPGRVNRLDAWLVANSLQPVLDRPLDTLIEKLNGFPGVSRRFERLAPNIYTDYAHTPPKIRGALQLAQEVAGKNVVVVYEGLHNTRQHFIKNELADLFQEVKQLYVVPSYLAREDKSLELLTPEKLLKLMNAQTRSQAAAAELNEDLRKIINYHAEQGDLVLCLSAGGAGSLDEWLRHTFSQKP